MLSDKDSSRSLNAYVAVSDPAELTSLKRWLADTPGVAVSQVGSRPESGELGALEALLIISSSSGLIAAIRTLPDFLRSRRSSIRIEVTVEGNSVVIEASNVEEVLPLLKQIIRG